MPSRPLESVHCSSLPGRTRLCAFSVNLSVEHATAVASHYELTTSKVTVRPLCAINIGTGISMSDTSFDTNPA